MTDTPTNKDFLIGQLFKVRRGSRIVKGVDYCSNKCGEYKYPVVTSTTKNNGIDGYYTEANCPGNSLVCGGEASGLFTTYQKDECWVMDRARIFEPLEKIIVNEYTGLYLATVFSQNQYRYPYGRSANPREIEKLEVSLPATTEGQPDFEYMENYVKSLRCDHITSSINQKAIELNIDEWEEFALGDLFALVKGRRLTKGDMVEGDINYLGAISDNNGVRQTIDVDASRIYKPNCITVNYNGSVGEAYYQHEAFWASDDVNVLYPKNWELNKYIALFICTVIKSNRYRFSYGRKWTLPKMKDFRIKLPAIDKEKPDFEHMEKFIKSLPYSDRV